MTWNGDEELLSPRALIKLDRLGLARHAAKGAKQRQQAIEEQTRRLDKLTYRILNDAETEAEAA